MKPQEKQVKFEMPVTDFTTGKLVGNLNVSYDLASGEIEYATWGGNVIRGIVSDLLKAVAPDFWDEVVAAKDAHREVELEADEKIEEDQL